MNFLLGPLVLAARPPRDMFGPIIHFVIGPGGPIQMGTLTSCQVWELCSDPTLISVVGPGCPKPGRDLFELPGLAAVFGPNTLCCSRTGLPKTRSGLVRAARSGSCVRTPHSLG